jgi:hypothetical protein
MSEKKKEVKEKPSNEWWHDFFAEHTHLGDGRKSNPPYVNIKSKL